ncbi:pentapeptide repeat-containing protein [Actinomadura fibrosa]|uniref:Pentapeptide repeat-containing protein n=2 Tax=Actinomadura fibrosa TaxID=111802 RepID=A0ABW2XVL3_9ACTN
MPEPGDGASSEAAPRQRRWWGRRPAVPEPTAAELAALPARDRLELLGQGRQARHQTLNSIGIAFGVVFTAASLIATAFTVRTAQDDLRTSKEGQVTDRYTKAVEQLGSNKAEVRMGGIYALERLMDDSPRDRRTITEVLAAYVRTHAQDRPPTGSDKTRLAVDVESALTVMRRAPRLTGVVIDLRNVDFHGKNLITAKLTHVNLVGANLADANLVGTDLADANMGGANLTRVNLAAARLSNASMTYADLTEADLTGEKLAGQGIFAADLTHANLLGARLTRARLSGVRLSRADLVRADLTGADLRNADLSSANLFGANLAGADLRGAEGVSENAVRQIARTNNKTRF